MTRRTVRRGLGLLEVIVCTALVAVLVIPVAGVIRASGQAIAQSNGSNSTAAELRRSLRWLADEVRDGTVVTVSTRQMQVQLSSGDTVTVAVQAGSLVMTGGPNPIVLIENVRDIRFAELSSATPPIRRVGVTMTLRARDAVTGRMVSISSTVAIPTQI